MAFSTIPTAGLSTGGANFRNLIINGDMSIAQRSTSEASKGADPGYFTVDRMYYFENGTTDVRFTQSQSTDVPSGQGFASSIKFDCTTADASLATDNQLVLKHRLEGQNLQQIKFGTSSAESLTLSFWIKSTKTGTFIVELSREGSRKISKSYTVSSSDTWEKKTLTFPPDTGGSGLSNDNGNRLEVNMYMGVGTNYSSGTLNTSWSAPSNTDRAVGQVNAFDSTSNNFYLTGVQLEVGTSASDFEFLPYDVNLQRCQRYFEQTYAMGTATGTATGTGSSRVSGTTDASSNITYNQPFRVVKRTTPTITTYNASGTSGVWNYARSGASGTLSTNDWTTNDKLVGLYWTVGGGWNFAIAQTEGHWVADAEL